MEFLETIRDFTETGGQVLLVIGFLIFVMWLLILERVLYTFIGHRQFKKECIAQWNARSDKSSWYAEQIRQKVISQLTMRFSQSIPVIQALVALCPLLGLMGTVTGMIEVFDSMAMLGSGNARAMASGVSKATIPTMAGMVGALSGVFASTWLARKAKVEKTHIEDVISLDHEG
ncbi:MotA/TolQ/ExbB proton channel family protein [Neptunicella marina]|uniref:MotA/TolQ/ExbB proton channel family protein n=1 Tax=Neptunicella marina TaxID=2125989 RepID=A0A8J6ILX1_9ALTE|nr:MotA/TolQ/ExbB proton channel family protein [Neptunicella marina]MBC3764815.1 MotA/TolQ/ExbB proton channel family protein [Neptunicella marina]